MYWLPFAPTTHTQLSLPSFLLSPIYQSLLIPLLSSFPLVPSSIPFLFPSTIPFLLSLLAFLTVSSPFLPSSLHPAAPSSILNYPSSTPLFHSYSPPFHPLPPSLTTICRSVFADDITEQSNEFPVPKSASISGLIPRAPTGSEWSPSKPSRTTSHRGSDSDILEFQDVLRDLDKKAV